MVTTGARAARLSAILAKRGHVLSDRKPAAPRLSSLDANSVDAMLELYRSMGGIGDHPPLRPGSWDLAFTNGLVIELDEELHFNRYRAATLARDKPWSLDYTAQSRAHEQECLRAGRWGRRWSSRPSVAMFGPADLPGVFAANGAPRWKQRAFYDAMKDVANGVKLARLSVHDRVGDLSLGVALRPGSEPDGDAIADLLERRSQPL